MPSLLCTLMASIAVFAVGVGPQVDRPDAEVPTAIERALMERECVATETVSAESYAHQHCLDAKLLWLRNDFGRDLSRLSALDRRRIDAACSRLRASDQREAYLDCLSAQLTVVHNRQNRGNTTTPEEAVMASAATPQSAALPASQQTPQASSWGVFALVGGSTAGLLMVGGVAFVALKSRRTTHPCRVCGVVVADSDLCPTCRHEAAEALRRAASERAQTQKALEEEERRQRESEAEERERKARDEEEARLRELELARQRQEEEELQRQVQATVSVAATPSPASIEETDVFDPYVVLGVPSEAGPDAIREAYQQAMTKYDPRQVEFLGDEAQAHFKTKAQSIERAYQMLSGA
ncbi:MAG TPA: DnaJ domain-containing protein [Vicinamibacterales bacterium]|nr:DnaJ domain-containing protein [Vicinamibacterales bacterium]